MSVNVTAAYHALESMYISRKGAELKKLEIDSSVPSNAPFFIRLDGCAFSTLLKGVVKPFDSRITDAMVLTTGDLVSKFQATLGYTSSDEISLIFPACKEDEAVSGDKKRKIERSHTYNGRMQKLSSVTAGYASSRFNYHLCKCPFEDLSEVTRGRLHSGVAHFDSRVCIAPDEKTVMETVYWRSNFDAFRNAVSQISQKNFTVKELQGKSVKQQVIECTKIGQNPFEFHRRYLFGSWIKKEMYNLEAVDRKTNEIVIVTRTKLSVGSYNWGEWTDEERIKFSFGKLWSDWPKDEETSDRLFGKPIERLI